MKRIPVIALGCLTCGLAASSHAGQVVLDNLANPLNNYLGGFSYEEVGDDFTLAPGGRTFESAKVAYLASPTPGAAFDGDETLTLNLYAMDGSPTVGSFGFNTPGTLLFSQTVPITQTDNGLALFSDATASILLPDFLGVGLVFNGVDLGSGEDRGPLLYDPTASGSSLDDYWLRGFPNPGDDRGLFTFGGTPPVNLGVQIEVVSAAIPEPSTWLGMCGLGVILGNFVVRRMRRA